MEKIIKFFKVRERGSTMKTELLAGLTTFLAMAYILPVNSGVLGDAGVPVAGVFFATIMASLIAAVIMGWFANYPVALAPGMGVNAFFAYTVVGIYDLSWEAALAAVLLSGVLFLILSLSGLRKLVIDAIPMGLKYAVGAGIGFFITFIGLKNMGVIVGDDETFVKLGDLGHPAVLLGVFGLVLVIALYAKGFRFSLITAMAVTAVAGIVLNALGVAHMPTLADDQQGILSGAGETFFAAFRGFGELFGRPEAVFIIFTFLFVDFFDTAGTLIAVGERAGLIDEKGDLKGGNRALIADSVGTVAGALFGTSTVTSYIESSTGIEQGGRTGITAITTGVLFFLALLIYPLIGLFTGIYDPDTEITYSPVTSMALVMVGALMFSQLQNLNFEDKPLLISAFLTISFMVFTYSIAEGIAVGFIFYPLAMIVAGRRKEVSPVMYFLLAFFILYFILTILYV
ncbi:MAG: NCS2 family permease [Bacillota bacterium]